MYILYLYMKHNGSSDIIEKYTTFKLIPLTQVHVYRCF